MSIIHFHLNEAQEKVLHQFMEKEGFTNKSEFFRFLMKFYEYHKPLPQNTSLSDDKNIPSVSQASEMSDVESNHATSDDNLSPRKQKLLNDPYIFDEGVRQLIRNMKD